MHWANTPDDAMKDKFAQRLEWERGGTRDEEEARRRKREEAKRAEGRRKRRREEEKERRREGVQDRRREGEKERRREDRRRKLLTPWAAEIPRLPRPSPTAEGQSSAERYTGSRSMRSAAIWHAPKATRRVWNSPHTGAAGAACRWRTHASRAAVFTCRRAPWPSCRAASPSSPPGSP
jgi:hypothetical protein